MGATGRELGRLVLRGTEAAAVRFDALPLSPHRLGSRLLDGVWAARRRRAERDPEWAAVEVLRGPDGDVEWDESIGLDLSSRRRQDEIGERLHPDGWWVPLAWALHAARAERAVSAARELAERAVRGWTEADLRDLYDVLPRTIGAQLLALADLDEHDHADDPADEQFPTVAAWTSALRTHGRVLATVGDPDGETDRTLTAWNDVATTPGHDRVLERRLSEAHARATREASQAVRASLVWVADHRERLWI